MRISGSQHEDSRRSVEMGQNLQIGKALWVLRNAIAEPVPFDVTIDVEAARIVRRFARPDEMQMELLRQSWAAATQQRKALKQPTENVVRVRQHGAGVDQVELTRVSGEKPGRAAVRS